MTDAYIGMGSNLGDAATQLEKAAAAIRAEEGLHLAHLSPLYWTEPQDMPDQPWFANQVAHVQCSEDWTAVRLLDYLLELETRLGRTRSTDPALRFGPRAIDLDVLLFGSEVSDNPHCTVPHPRMLRRAFVLVPLRDVRTQDMLPDGTKISYALGRLAYAVRGQNIYQSL